MRIVNIFSPGLPFSHHRVISQVQQLKIFYVKSKVTLETCKYLFPELPNPRETAWILLKLTKSSSYLVCK